MKCPIEKRMAKLWLKLEMEFWLKLCEQAPNKALHHAYNRQAYLVGIPFKERPQYDAQHISYGRSVALFCPKCGNGYENCHPTEPCYCPCETPYPQLVTKEAIDAVTMATRRFIFNKAFDNTFGKGFRFKP